MECLICFEENKECVLCYNKKCNKYICYDCINKLKFNTDLICQYNNNLIDKFQKELKTIQCPFCREKFKIYITIRNIEYEVLGYDKRNTLFKVKANEEITYLRLNSTIHWGYIPELDYPSIFQEDIIEEAHQDLKTMIINSNDNEVVFDNNERMVF